LPTRQADLHARLPAPHADLHARLPAPDDRRGSARVATTIRRVRSPVALIELLSAREQQRLPVLVLRAMQPPARRLLLVLLAALAAATLALGAAGALGPAGAQARPRAHASAAGMAGGGREE